ncbi:MAG: hypothetical protein FJW86_07930 [Actinobacteria bacterium]|nr:hypothetical protein [Actinomycetota bacterium]
MPTSLTIQPWPDPVIDTVGHDPRSVYAETFWLPTLGPTALLLLRHLASRFEQQAGSIELPVAEASQALGLGERAGNSSPIVRSLTRLESFDLACSDGRGTVAVRQNLPPLPHRHVRRLPAPLQTEHARWAEASLAEPPHAEARRRARRMALALLEQGDDFDHVERVLFSTGYHPTVCHDAARWAWQRHRDAAAAAGLEPVGGADQDR